MMAVLSAATVRELHAFLNNEVETCAVCLLRRRTADTWVEHKKIVVPDRAYSLRSRTRAELKSSFIFEVSEAAKQLDAGVMLIHAHTDSNTDPIFSSIDDDGERSLRDYLDAKLPGRLHCSLIISSQGCRAREMRGSEIGVKEVGSAIRYLFDPTTNNAQEHQDIYDRQVRAFGAAGQRLIGQTKVALVGLGGTGSVAVQELAYLGVCDFVLIDDQDLETTNRNRVIGSEPSDVGQPKTEISERLVKRINPGASFESIKDSIIKPEVQERLIGCDFIFICTDNHLSRLKVTQLCYRHLIPAIDIGVAIATKNGNIESISGRVQMIAPGLPCLMCTNSINPDAIRREALSEEQKKADPYFEGDGEPQPAVVSLNSTMSSLAVTMFCAAITNMPISARLLRYDGLTSSVRRVTPSSPHPTCPICSASGELGAGAFQ